MVDAVPASVHEVDVAWLRAAVDTPWAAHVESARCEPLDVQGSAGAVHRLRLSYGRAAAGPETLILKLPPASVTQQRGLSRAGFGATEVGFYRDLAGRVPMATPRCHLARCDAEGRAVLLLEDLGDVPASWPQPAIGPAEAPVMLEQLAQLHARFWNDAGLAELGWLGTPPDRVEFYRDALGSLLRLLPRHLDGEVPAGVVRLLEVLVPRLGAVAAELAGPPFTLVHGDFTQRNSALRDGVPVAFDWQLTQRARGARDVAYLMPFLALGDSGVRPRALVDDYHARLRALGVGGYARDELQCDQDLATLDVMQVGMITMLIPLGHARDQGTRAPVRGSLNLLPAIAAGAERLGLIERLREMPED